MLFEASNVDGITYKEIPHKERREKRSEEKKKEKKRTGEGKRKGKKKERERETDSLRNLQSLRYKQIRKNLQRLSLWVNYDVRGY